MKFKRIKSKSEISENDVCDGYLIDASEFEARKIVASLKGKKSYKKVGILGRDDNFNRRVIETLKIDYLFSPERGNKIDGLKQRDSGLNHVVASAAKKNGIDIVVDFNEIKKLGDREKALRIGRIIQNIVICRKVGCKIRIWDSSGFSENKELASFGVSLGMNSQQSRDAVLM
jgi:RNase P/RNase MRP subunit p30